MAAEQDMDAVDEVGEVTETPRQKRRWARTVAKWSAIVLVGVVALLALLVFGINSNPGRRFVAEQIQGLEFENGMKIGVGRIDGSLYGLMTIHDLSIRDTRGEFLYSPEVKVDWKPFKFIDNHIAIDSLTARQMFLRRVPQFKPTPPSNDPLLPDYDIDIDTFRIDRFVAEKPVTGEVRIARLSGKTHIADGRAQVTLAGRTLAGGGVNGGDALSLILDAVPDQNRFDVDLAVKAPGDGVVAALSGLTEPLALTVKGKGSWTNWNGKLQAALGGQPLTDLAIAARDGTIAVKGPARLSRFVTGPTAALLGPSTDIDLAATLSERRADLTGSVSSDAMRVNTNGIVDLGESSFDDLKVTFVLLRPSALAENLSGSGLRGNLTLNGAFTTPAVEYAVNANRLVMNDMGLDQFSARGAARVDADQIVVPVDARARRITGLDTVAGGTLTNVRLAGDVAIDGPRVLSDNMRIRSDRIDAKVILLADTSRGFYTGAIDGKIDNYRVESVGIFDIQTDVDLKTEGAGFALAGNVRARSRRIDNASVADFLGGQAVASSDVRYGPDGVVRFANLRLQAPAVRITGGRGSYSPDGRIALVADAVSRDYGKVGVQVAGTISNPDARITAERPDLGVGLANLRARITGARGGYRLDLTGDTDYGALTADVILGTGPATSLTINRANLSGIDFTGSLRQTRSGPYAGELRADGNGLGGVVRLGAQGRYQEAIVNLRAKGTTLQGPAQLAIGSAIVDARVVLYDTPQVIADAQFADTRIQDYYFNAGRVLVDYQGGRGSAKAVLEGTAGAPFKVAANARLEPRLWTAMLTGKARGITFATKSPARIVPGPRGYELLPTRIDTDSGSVKLAGTYGPGLKVQSRLEKLDLAIVNTFLPGTGLSGSATGSLDFEQPDESSFPRADARLTLNNFTRTTAATVSQPVDINFVGKLLPNGGEARAVFRRRGSVIGRMVASLQPLPPGAGPWTTRLLSAPLGGGIRYNGPADTLFSFAGLSDQRLSGPIGVAADFSCRVASPCINGIVRANSLVYENLTYGTRLSNMALAGTFSGDRLQIDRMTATAGNGTVEANGFISLASASGYPMNLDMKLQNARIARSDTLTTRATGELKLTKTAGETALLSGRLLLPETRYVVVRQGAAQVPELTGVRFKPPVGPQRITGEEPAESVSGVFSTVRLDIELEAPERLYVSGMGLESEWSANFRVGGTNASPTMAGQVELIRGTLGFAGRSFELTQGRIAFTGGQVVDPVLQIVATEDVDDVTVNVNVGGRATDPEITFSSIPGLPQDEIMSRILFGSSIANLSTLQAVQLAASLNSLRGSGGGLNPLGKLRSATGIDRLRILGPDETTGRGTALAAGQYLTDDIYVELITDTRGFTATQLEVSVTPWLSLLSQAGGSGVSNVNVRIKKNY